MGIFFAVLFLCLVIAMGMGAIKQLVVPRKKPETIKEIVVPEESGEIPLDVRILLLALEQEAKALEGPPGLHYINEPVLTTMIEKIDRDHDLIWLAPLAGFRIREMKKDAPYELRDHYDMMLITRRFIIGYNTQR